jgi:hypothetical protein
MTVALQRGNQLGQEGQQALAADRVSCAIRDGQRLPDFCAAPASPWPSDCFGWSNWTEQQADRALAFVASDPDELVEDR